MNYQEKQILQLKKQFSSKEEEWKKQRKLLQQKIELLQNEISQSQEKQLKNRQLNDSILISYRQNESFKDQFNHKQIQNLKSSHQDEIRRLKQKANEQKKKFQEQIEVFRCENQNLKTQIDRIRFDCEKKEAELTKEWEQKLISKEEELEKRYALTLNLLNDKLKQTEDICRLYKDQLQMGLGTTLKASIQMQKSKEPSREKTLKCRQKGKESALSMRINRVLAQINPNTAKLEQKIREITSKRM